MRGLSKRLIESIFIAAEMVFFTDGAGLNSNVVAGLKAGAGAVLALRYFHVDWRIDYANDMAQKSPPIS